MIFMNTLILTLSICIWQTKKRFSSTLSSSTSRRDHKSSKKLRWWWRWPVPTDVCACPNLDKFLSHSIITFSGGFWVAYCPHVVTSLSLSLWVCSRGTKAIRKRYPENVWISHWKKISLIDLKKFDCVRQEHFTVYTFWSNNDSDIQNYWKILLSITTTITYLKRYLIS